MVAVQVDEKTSSKYIQASWIKLHYNDVGTGDPPIIFLHGSGPGASSWSNFARNVGVFSQHKRCILLDQPNFGKTDPYVYAEPTGNVNARAVLDTMDALGLDKAILVGNSMGGGPALTFAVDHPERVEKLVLMGSGGGGGISLFAHVPSEGIKVVNDTFDHPSQEQMRKVIDIMLYDGSTVPDEVLGQRLEAFKEEFRIARQQSRPVMRNFSADLVNIQAPTLIIHGRNDRVVPYENSLALVSAIPNSKLVLFNKCGHWAQYEHADEFNRLVLDFVLN